MTWIIYGLLSALTAALVALCGKMGLTGIDPVLATTLRSGIMCICMLMFSGVLHKFDIAKITALPINGWYWIIAAGIAGASSWLFYFIALSMGPMSKIVALDRLSLVFAFILGAFVLGEQVTLYNILGLLLMVIGSILIVG